MAEVTQEQIGIVMSMAANSGGVYQAALRALLAAYEERGRWLAECYRLSGADPDGNEDWRLAPDAVAEVREMRERWDAAEAALRAEQDTHARTIADLNGMTAERNSLREQLKAAQAQARELALCESCEAVGVPCTRHLPKWAADLYAQLLEAKRQLASEVEKRKKLRELIDKIIQWVCHPCDDLVRKLLVDEQSKEESDA